MVKLLIDTVGRDEEGNEGTPLYLSALAVWATGVRGLDEGERRGMMLAKFLVEMGADASVVGTSVGDVEFTSLVWAARAVAENQDAGMELVRLLLSAGAKLADDEGDHQQHVDKILGIWAVRTATTIMF